MVGTTINIRTDSELKTQAQTLFDMLGIDMTTAVNMFLKQVVLRKAIPFEISAQNPRTESYYNVAERNSNSKISLSKSMIDKILQEDDLRSITGVLHTDTSADDIREERLKKYDRVN